MKFTLKGANAFFKIPEVNSYFYFTYSHIHKIALLGMFGAILGYGGYNQMPKKKKNSELVSSYPEFYSRLKDIQVSICPNSEKGFIPKKIQTFNNSVGYASNEQGGNLIVKEQWLDHPSWDIYVQINNEETEKLCEFICSHTCIYHPYLGKNDHLADIINIKIYNETKVDFDRGQLNCLYPSDIASVVILDEFEKEELDSLTTYKYQEQLPYLMDELTNNYILRKFLYTDALLEKILTDVYYCDEKNIVFY